MKRTIEGFLQSELVRLGLDAKDALILRWFSDLFSYPTISGRPSPAIRWFIGGNEGLYHEDRGYILVLYVCVMQELPCLGLRTEKTIEARFRKLEEAGALISLDRKKPVGKGWWRPNRAVMNGLVGDYITISSEPKGVES